MRAATRAGDAAADPDPDTDPDDLIVCLPFPVFPPRCQLAFWEYCSERAGSQLVTLLLVGGWSPAGCWWVVEIVVHRPAVRESGSPALLPPSPAGVRCWRPNVASSQPPERIYSPQHARLGAMDACSVPLGATSASGVHAFPRLCARARSPARRQCAAETCSQAESRSRGESGRRRRRCHLPAAAEVSREGATGGESKGHHAGY